jgi:hypothetical protein
MLLAAQGIGWSFLAYSSPNRTIAGIIMLCIFLLKQVDSYLHYYYYVFAAYWTSHRRTISKMSNIEKQQFEKRIQSHTRQQLEKLRAHLQSNPKDYLQTINKLQVDGKSDVANLVQQFQANIYSGRPPRPADTEIMTWWENLWRSISSIFVMIVIGGLLTALFTVKFSNEQTQ